jgi:hypothetical protein
VSPVASILVVTAIAISTPIMGRIKAGFILVICLVCRRQVSYP